MAKQKVLEPDQITPKPVKGTRKKNSDSGSALFPIVGIGASAGGLESFELFFSKVPENSDMAYVVIQHLDPTQKGMLPELLQRYTKLKVFQAKERMAVKPNCVYVIPPNTTMSILKGRLHLFEPIETRGLRLPIDFFFRSLADDIHGRSVGVILSGMGSDGSIGLRSIKEKNGLVMVQDPSTAKYDSMPRNALESVQVDILAPADELLPKLLDFNKHIPGIVSDVSNVNKDKSSLEKIIILLRINTGNDFSLYKKNTLYRRIERRMGIHKIDKINSYVHFLQDNPKEVGILFKELLIGVTNFFRDPEVWEKLKSTSIANLLACKQPNTTLRAWVPACSTGEEAYSLAIVFKEALEKNKSLANFSLQIFATDLDSDSIEKARKGLFPANIATDVSQSRLTRFFVKTDDGYQVNTEIREMVVFAEHNIIMHPPFTKIDILSCRNLLIYLDNELQKKILGLFYYSLNPEGIMLLGCSETLGVQSHLFIPLDSKMRIYKRSENTQASALFDFPSSYLRTRPTNIDNPIPPKSTPNIQVLTDQLLLQQFSPAGVLVNENGDIVYISGRTGKYLEPAVGKANLNIFAMLREGLYNEFSTAFRNAIKKKEVVVIHNIKVGTNGGTQSVNIKIIWLDKPDTLRGLVLIVFYDVQEIREHSIEASKGKKTASTKHMQLEEEVKRLRQEMQNTYEEMQTSQEELKSTNEELQSANEELQSSNEELTSSKEEMQSLNEELQTVNAELQSKVDDFTRVNNDMKNLLNSTDIATLFLDKDLNIRRYTNQATKIFKLIKSDIGRPFTDQVSDLVYPGLATDALEVLSTLIFIQKEIPTKDGRWFLVRIMPYRTFDDIIDGLVITFFNITDHKNLESELQQKEQAFRLLMNLSTDVIIELSTDWKIQELNSKAEIFLKKNRKDLLNQSFFQLFTPELLRKKVEREMKKQLKVKQEFTYKSPLMVTEKGSVEVEWTVKELLNNLNQTNGLIIITKTK
jgi:two-component system CheB/CheR fusion protein